jgi:hypothetical protein
MRGKAGIIIRIGEAFVKCRLGKIMIALEKGAWYNTDDAGK